MNQTVVTVLAAALAVAGASALADSPNGMDSHGGSMRMTEAAKDARPAGPVHHAVGTVKRVDAAKGSVTISHGPVTTLNWPAMTMTFGVKEKALLTQLAVGKKVAIDFVEEGANYTILNVKAS